MQLGFSLLVTAGVFASLMGCRHDLRPRLILQGEPVGDEFWLAAPYIAAVTIANSNLDGPAQPIFEGGPKTLQLMKFVANVDNVIKGDLRSKTITFYFFAKLDQNPNYYLYPGRRYIVSLRHEGGVLRSWTDATQLKVEVHSGLHRQQDLPLDLGPGTAIAYILLTPGRDCDLSEFEANIRWPSSYGEPGYVSERLRELQLNANPGIRDSACLAAARMFGHRPGCLEAASKSSDENIRQAAAGFLNGADDADLLGRLRNNPLSILPVQSGNYMLQMLDIYAQDVRPEVRRAACTSLRNLAPQRSVASCK